MLRLKHIALLTWQVAGYGSDNGAWWLLLVLPIVLAAMAVVGTAHAVVPYAVYTLF